MEKQNMATYPREEEKIVTLAQAMIDGFTNNSDIFPSPPVDPTALQAALTAFLANPLCLMPMLTVLGKCFAICLRRW